MNDESGDPFNITRALIAALAIVLFVVSIFHGLFIPATVALLSLLVLRHLE